MTRFSTLERVLRNELAKPYDLGRADCFFMGLAVVDELSGSALRGEYAGAYRTLAGAHRALLKRGHESLSALLAGHLEQIGKARAVIGDIAVLRLPDGAEHIGVCVGLHFITKTPAGRAAYDLTSVVAAFKVPDQKT